MAAEVPKRHWSLGLPAPTPPGLYEGLYVPEAPATHMPKCLSYLMPQPWLALAGPKADVTNMTSAWPLEHSTECGCPLAILGSSCTPT